MSFQVVAFSFKNRETLHFPVNPGKDVTLSLKIISIFNSFKIISITFWKNLTLNIFACSQRGKKSLHFILGFNPHQLQCVIVFLAQINFIEHFSFCWLLLIAEAQCCSSMSCRDKLTFANRPLKETEQRLHVLHWSNGLRI